MKLVAMKQALGRAQGLCGRGASGTVRLLTFKKDRSVTVSAVDGMVRVAEQGFSSQVVEVPAGSEARRALREACRREFPRSNKLSVRE